MRYSTSLDKNKPSRNPGDRDNTICSLPVYLPHWIRVPSHRSHCVRNVRMCLVSKPHQESDQYAKNLSLFETFLERVSPTRSNAYTTNHRKPRKNTSNPAICQYISELNQQLFDAGIARIQPRVSFCFRVLIDQSANASLHVTRLLCRGSSYFACSFLEERQVVSQRSKSVSPCCCLIRYRGKDITTL